MNRWLPLFLLIFTSELAACQNYNQRRQEMVRKQIESRGVDDMATLEAMRKVERHLFVPEPYQKYAYEDTALPIGFEQTISQPYIVAAMTALIEPKKSDRVLEIGTGSGYQAAVLAEIVNEVYTIEIVRELGQKTKKLLQDLGYQNIHVLIGDGYKGYEAKAPFDAILVTAAPEAVPPPLISQLKEGGRMVIPLGKPGDIQTLSLLEKRNGKIVTTKIADVRFVPFTRE